MAGASIPTLWRCPTWNCPEIVYVANADGSGQRPFTAAITNTSSPFWAPDGTKVALIDHGPGGQETQIRMLNADGTAPTPAFDPQSFGVYPLVREWISWSPDSSRVAAIFSVGGRARLCISRGGEGGGPFCLAQLENVDGLPDWSPDGATIAVRTAVVEGASALYAVPVDGSAPRKLADCGLGCYAPQWSPDGRKVLFTDGAGGASAVFTIGADGQGRTALTGEGVVVDRPVWSPDGRQIAFSDMDLPTFTASIYVVNADGTGLARVVEDGRYPDWRPEARTQ